MAEYIITGGFQAGDPRQNRTSEGIHEPFVHLRSNLAKELKKPGRRDLPACLISEFFGSGKSRFAKLLGYSLDHRQLPNGKSLAEALLEPNDSPRQEEFRTAWKEATEGIQLVASKSSPAGVVNTVPEVPSGPM